MDRYCEFEFESLTVREWNDLMKFQENPTFEKMERIVEVMQAHTNTDLMNLSPSDVVDALNQFAIQSQEFAQAVQEEKDRNAKRNHA